MPYIHSVQTALAPHYYDQEQLIARLLAHWGNRFYNPQRIVDFQRNVLVGGRHLALTMEEYERAEGFGAHNDAWIEVAVPMAERAVATLLDEAGLAAADIDMLTTTTVTGIAVPSLEARLMNRLPFRRDTKRMPLFGLGCLAGAAGINRVADYLVGHPDQAAILISVELCSLTIQKEDLSVANIIASGLFGDGGAAVLLVGDEHPLAASAPLEVFGRRSAFFPDTERVMGWDVVDSGFKVVLANNVASLVASELPGELDDVLQSEGLDERPTFFVGHPGGPKVLHAAAEALGLDDTAFKKSWDSLARYGNMSSTSVLFVLRDVLDDLPEPGALGLIFAFGPAFCAELGLLRVQAPNGHAAGAHRRAASGEAPASAPA
jgi:alkylresorcinol/alkylpyrone synthase